MKRLFLSTIIACAALYSHAEGAPGCNPPTQLQAFYIDGKTTLWFVPAVDGGLVWTSNFSYANGLDGMRQLGDGDAWSNVGGGAEISTAIYGGTLSNHASSLATPQMSLQSGCDYRISYKSAGSRSSQNQSLTVSLYRGDSRVAVLVEEYELSASLNYEMHNASFAVDEAGEDYEIRFEFSPSEKVCGASLMQITVDAPVPEDRGDITGYNIYRNDEFARFCSLEEVSVNGLYNEIIDETTLEYSTTYTYALTTAYAGGGESAKSNTASFTTPEDPIVAVKSIETDNRSENCYDLLGRRSIGKGIIIKDNKITIR